jgi:hypothetical protein
MARIIDQNGRDVTSETLMAVHKVISGAGVGKDGTSEQLAKADGTVTVANGLVAYNLEGPAKNLYPVLTPIRNKLTRKTKKSGAGTAANWKRVRSISGGSSMPALPWVPEGQRAPRMSILVEDKNASYRTLGLESDVTFEAQHAGAGYEDVMASSGTRLLQQTMIQEEYALLGGNASVDLGAPAAPTLAVAAAAATLPAATYSVYCVALTFEGYLMASVAAGVKRSATITGMDGKTYDLNGGSSPISPQATQAVTLGQSLSMSVAAIRGAVAYAWYVGTAGAEKVEAITTINSYKITAPLVATGAAVSAITDDATDRSKNATAFDGLLYAAFNSSSLAYYKALDTGTPGTGTVLTATARGTITQIDDMLKSFWDNYKISPDVIYVSAQELTNIYNKCFTSGGSAMVRFVVDAANPQNMTFAAGQIIGWYVNPYSLAGGQMIPIQLHPNLPSGTIFAQVENLPAHYQSANVPEVAEVECRQDYYQIPWPVVTRANETGVYVEEVLKVYADFGLGVITNIANG